MEEEQMGSSIEKLGSGGPMPTWKLYDNPHYSSPRHDHASSPHGHHHHSAYNCLLPSASRLRSSLATLLRPMDCDGAPSELDLARAQLKEMRAELELERKMRRKAESLNRTLARELAEERSAREAAEAVCGRLAEEVARGREEAERVAREVEEERRMLRVAEVWREERVQMKLAEARLLFEEKLREMSPKPKEAREEEGSAIKAMAVGPPAMGSSGQTGQQSQQQRREVENPHIKRGIKGFVEFPKVVRLRANFAGASKEGKGHQGATTNLVECQKAQLRILLRHRNPVGLGLVGTSESLVM